MMDWTTSLYIETSNIYTYYICTHIYALILFAYNENGRQAESKKSTEHLANFTACI